MRLPVLTEYSVIMCPQPGYGPTRTDNRRVNGWWPLLLGDVYTVADCTFAPTTSLRTKVNRITAPTLLFVKGQPALNAASVGFCTGANGAGEGPAIVATVLPGSFDPSQPASLY